MKSEFKCFSKRLISGVLCIAILFQVVACGTILYPERQGRHNSGQIDVAVAVLDSVGFIFFIIPGVVAWVVDYNNGAIYLPKGKKYSKTETSPANRAEGNSESVVKIKLERLDSATIQRAIFQQTGHQVRMDDPKLIVKKMGEGVNVNRELLRLNSQFEKILPVQN